MPNADLGTAYFPETGKKVGGAFLRYWRANGGLAQQGYPISDEFQEKSALDGKVYTVQYFQRAVFEFHPENGGTPYEVLLSQLGTFLFREKYLYTKPVAPVSITLSQSQPQLSDSYLVWNECVEPPGSGNDFNTYTIRAMELATGKLIEVTPGRRGAQHLPTLSGSTVAWYAYRDVCPGSNCQFDIAVKDLATGAEMLIPKREGVSQKPAFALLDKTLFWVECYPSPQGCKLLSRELGKSEAQTVTDKIDKVFGAELMKPLQVNEEYLVWSGYIGLNLLTINALERKTGKLITLEKVEYDRFDGDGTPLRYSLSGHRVIIGDYRVGAAPYLLDLSTGEKTHLSMKPMEFLSFDGDVVVWTTAKGYTDPGVWGMDLRNQKSVPLVLNGHPVLKGDWLAWENSGGRSSGLLGAMPLSTAFATSEDRHNAKPDSRMFSELLRDVDMLSPDEGWAVGTGVILHYTNGNWEKEASPDGAFLNSIDMVSASEGWALGYVPDAHVLLHYLNNKWSRVDYPVQGGRSSKYLNDIDMVSPDEGWAVGDDILMHYKEGTWEEVPLPNSDTNGLVKVDMLSPEEGWAAGTFGTILHYSNGKWQRAARALTDGLYGFDMVSPNEGWAVAYQGTILHYNGTSWDNYPNPSKVTANTVRMVSKKEGWAIGQGGGILHYLDGQWSLIEGPIRGVWLTSIEMVSPSEGWIVGSSGTILRYQDGAWTLYD